MAVKKMTIAEQMTILPEIKASVYASAFNFSIRKVQKMCVSGVIPCRKLGKTPINKDKDNRTWMVNLEQIRQSLRDI